MYQHYVPNFDPHSLKSARKSNSPTILAHKKATWLKIEDGKEKEEKEKDKCKKRVKGVMKRNPSEGLNRKPTTRSTSNPRLYSSNNDGGYMEESAKPLSARSSSSVGFKESKRDNPEREKHRYIGSSSATRERDSNIDLDFADKIKAFRSLIKPGLRSRDSPREEPKKPETPSDDVTSHRGHLKFNAKSFEGRPPAPNEFQLTYAQDRNRALRNAYSPMVVYGHDHNGRKSQNIDDCVGARKDNIFVTNKEDAIREDGLSLHRNDDQGYTKLSHAMNEIKPSIGRIIRRPLLPTKPETSVECRVSPIQKPLRKEWESSENRGDIEGRVRYASRQYQNKDNEISSYRFKSYDRILSEATSNSTSPALCPPASIRPASTNVENQKRQSAVAFQRSQSAIQLDFAGRLHSNVGSVSSSLSDRKNGDGDNKLSLQTHLNVLGASLSSLSSIVNGESSENETAKRRSYSPMGLSSMVHGGNADDMSMHHTRLVDSHRRGGGTHALNTLEEKLNGLVLSKASDLSNTERPKAFLRGSVSSSNYTSEMTRPRSDEYLISERLGERPPHSPRVKQTNVKGMDEDQDSLVSNLMDEKPRPASASLISGGLGGISLHHGELRRMTSEGPRHASPTGESSTENRQNLRQYVRYIARNRNHDMSGNSSLDKGANQSDEETISHNTTSASTMLSVNGGTRHGHIYRERETERLSSDETNDDKLLDKESDTASSRDKHVSEITTVRSSSPGLRIISRHKTLENSHRSRFRTNYRESYETGYDEHEETGDVSKMNPEENVTPASTEKKRIVKRPRSSSRQKGRPDQMLQSDSTDNGHNPLHYHPVSERSQTVLGLCSTKESSKKIAILPSKYSMAGSIHSRRPRSALDSRTIKGDAKNKTNKDLLERYGERKETEIAGKSSATLKLLKKVQNLHQEVDKRLNSDENIAHSVTSSLSDLFQKVNNDSDDDLEIFSSSKKSEFGRKKIHGAHRVSDQSKMHGENGKIIIRRRDHPVKKTRGDFDLVPDEAYFSASRNVVSTSTPRNESGIRKTRTGIIPSPTILSKTGQQSTETGGAYTDEELVHANPITQDSPKPYSKASTLSRNLRKILEAHEYNNNNNFSTRPVHGSSESSILRKKSKERYREEFDDDKDEDDMMNEESCRRDNTMVYSESQGGSETRRTLSPFIARLAHVDISSRRVNQGMGQQMMEIHRMSSGRASPADVLMGYLDDPNTVRLLQRLYQADPADREILMIKVLYFKTWLHFSISAKQKRLKKQALMECADTFCYQRVLALHFITWEMNARYSQNVRHASCLFRRHMLSKGFRALQWSVSHSRHCRELIQTKYRIITTRASFDKWRNRTVKQRRERMENTMQRWKQFVTEVHKIRHMQALMDKNILEKVYSHWRKCYDKHMKQRMAFNYFRHTLCKHALSTWSSFVYTCKQKKEKYLSAVCQYQNNLIKTTFFQIVFAFKKSKRARTHFRQQKLNEVFWSWKGASHICRNERQRDMILSGDHCRMQLIKNSFRQWKQRVLLCKADAHANSHLYRKTFSLWLQSYHEKFTKRQEIEIAVERKKLHRALLTWRRNVVQIKRRHKQAVILLEMCFLQTTLKTWKHYVGTRVEMRNKVSRHQKDQEKKKMNVWFSLWLNKYREKLGAKKRQLFWSESCARKLSWQWRHICHLRSLERKLEDSQPERELRFLHTMFMRWQMVLEKRRQEEEEAEHMRRNLEQHKLQKSLQIWKIATQKQILIKPLLRQREKRTMKECFQGWSLYTHSIVNCRKSKAEFVKISMRKCFMSWRHRYTARQVEKRIKSQFSQGLLLCCFEEWRSLVQHKKRGQDFRHKNLVTKMFVFWKEAAAYQVTKRNVLKEEEIYNTELKRKIFVTWWENVQEQKTVADVCVSQFSLVRGKRTVSNAFTEWKRLLHSTLIARAYQKMFNQRLALTLLLEWHAQIRSDVCDAVSLFQERIGLSRNDGRLRYRESTPMHVRESTPMHEGWLGSQGTGSEFGDYLEKDVDMNSPVFGSFSSSYTAGLFGRLLDENSSIDSDTDRSFLLSGGLQDAANDHQNKCTKMREIVTASVNRLQHWPICVAFQQWQEFTARQIQLKNSAKQVKTILDTLDTASTFRQWRVMHAKMKRAREHWNSQLVSSTFTTLHKYTLHCRHVKKLASYSEKHLRLKVFCRYFPIWLRKTQKQRREKHVVTLWTSSTAEELELLPLENQLTWKLNGRTLRLCFSLWLLKVSHIQKIRHVYETNTSQWVFSAWQEWASYQQCLVKKSRTMVCVRRTRMAFKRWRDKYHQSRQTEMLYRQAWQHYQIQILVEWHQWAKASRQCRSISNSFGKHRSHRMVKSHFMVWKSLTYKAGVIQRRQRTTLMLNVFKDWCQFIQDSKAKKQMTIHFQIRSYTLLVKRLFQHWHSSMVHQRDVKEKMIQKAENTALYYAQLWRKKCQTSRGRKLQSIFQSRKVSIYVQTWVLRLQSVQLLHDRLEVCQKKKNSQLLKAYLQTWVLNFKGNQVSRDYTSKLLCSIVYEWKTFTKENRDRRRRGLALTKALQERNLHVYFQFWVAITRVKVSVRFNAETKLQIRIMRSWYAHARNMSYLRQLQVHFTQRVNTRILTDAFTKLKWRAEYCSHLQEVADKIVHDRVRATLTAVIILWKHRLDCILAARCYGGILVVRVVRQWHRFVHKRKAEREKELNDHLKAVNFDCKSICKRAFSALKELVVVSKMAAKKRQRLCDKYALIWKRHVDLQTSAMEIEWEILCWSTWQKWRREFAQRQAVKKVEKANNRYRMAQVFKSWQNLCKPSRETSFYQSLTPRSEKRSSPSSQLPVPIGRGFPMSSTVSSPSSSSSSLSSFH